MTETATAPESPPVEAAPAAPTARGETPKPTEAQLTALFGAEPGDEPEPAPKGTKEESPEETEEPQEPDADFDAVFQALLAAGVPPSVLKNAKRADLTKWSQTEVKRAADIQSAFQERADLKKRVEELSKTATSKGPEPSSGVPTGTEDLADIYAELTGNEGFGPDLGKPLAAFTQKLLAKAEARIEAKYAQRFGEMNVGTMATREMLIEGARAQLTERFPELKDDTKLGKVVEKMQTLVATGAYMDAPTVRAGALSCMEDACGLVFKAKPSADPAKKKEVSRARDNGQPIVDSANRPTKGLTTEEVARRRFYAREEGASDDEVQRIR